MGLGGYTDDSFLFKLYWLAHLVGGCCYIICTIIVPLARFSAEGEACALLNPINGDRTAVVYGTHAALFMVYVFSMCSITYYSLIKPTFFPKKLEMSNAVVADE
jgi:hypothetical protein